MNNDDFSDELDLNAIFDSVCRSLKRIVFLHKNNSIKILVFVALFATLGFLKRKYEPSVYSSSLIIEHSRLDNEYCRKIIANLNTRIKSSSSLVESIAFNNFDLDDRKGRKRDVITFSPFEINVLVYDVKILDSLQTLIVQELEETPAISKKKTFEKEQALKTLRELKTEIASLDSLKIKTLQLIEEKDHSKRGGISIEDLYSQTIPLITERNNIEQQLFEINTFNVVMDFSPPKIANKSKTVSALLFGLLGYLLFLSYLAFVKASKK